MLMMLGESGADAWAGSSSMDSTVTQQLFSMQQIKQYKTIDFNLFHDLHSYVYSFLSYHSDIFNKCLGGLFRKQ